MAVAIDEAGQHGLAREIDDTRAAAGPCLHFGFATDIRIGVVSEYIDYDGRTRRCLCVVIPGCRRIVFASDGDFYGRRSSATVVVADGVSERVCGSLAYR